MEHPEQEDMISKIMEDLDVSRIEAEVIYSSESLKSDPKLEITQEDVEQGVKENRGILLKGTITRVYFGDTCAYNSRRKNIYVDVDYYYDTREVDESEKKLIKEIIKKNEKIYQKKQDINIGRRGEFRNILSASIELTRRNAEIIELEEEVKGLRSNISKAANEEIKRQSNRHLCELNITPALIRAYNTSKEVSPLAHDIFEDYNKNTYYQERSLLHRPTEIYIEYDENYPLKERIWLKLFHCIKPYVLGGVEHRYDRTEAWLQVVYEYDIPGGPVRTDPRKYFFESDGSGLRYGTLIEGR